MGYAGKVRERQLAIKLRKKGLSYNEIRKQVPLAKSTLSYWCRDIILTLDQIERLQQRKLEGAEKGRFIGSRRQQQDRIKRTKKLLEKGKEKWGE